MPHGNVKPLSEQVIVIFGGTSGIGRACALDLYKYGARLVLASRSRFGVLKTCRDVDTQCDDRSVKTDYMSDHTKLVYKSDRVLGIECDVVDSVQIKQVFQMTLDLMESANNEPTTIDTVIFSSAVFMFSRFEESTMDEIEQITNVNYLGACRVAKEIIPIMKRQYRASTSPAPYFGTLVMISSVESRSGILNQSAYSSSKHAMDSLVQVLTQEFIADRVPIHLHSILPSAIDTPLYDKCRQKVRDSTSEQKFVKLGPPPLIYSPELVAQSVVNAVKSPRHSFWYLETRRDLIVGSSGWIVLQVQKVAGGLLDFLTGKFGDWIERLYVIPSEQREGNIAMAEQQTLTGGGGASRLGEKIVGFQKDNLFKPVEGNPDLYESRGKWCLPNSVHNFSLYNYISELRFLPW